MDDGMREPYDKCKDCKDDICDACWIIWKTQAKQWDDSYSTCGYCDRCNAMEEK